MHGLGFCLREYGAAAGNSQVPNENKRLSQSGTPEPTPSMTDQACTRMTPRWERRLVLRKERATDGKKRRSCPS